MFYHLFRLERCFLTENSGEALASVLSSNPQLRIVDLSHNDLRSGVKLIAKGLEDGKSRLEELRLVSYVLC